MHIFIAVVAVLLLMNIFFFFAFRSVTNRLGVAAKRNMLNQTKFYNDLLDNKEDKLKQLQIEIDELEKKTHSDNLPMMVTQTALPPSLDMNPFLTSSGRYRNEGFVEAYRSIRQTFVFDKNAYVQQIVDSPEDLEQEKRKVLYQKMLDKLDLDVLYSLTVLPWEKQHEELKTLLAPEELVIFQEYIDNEKSLDILSFTEWLQAQNFQHSPYVTVRTGQKSDDYSQLGSQVKTEVDENICEGVYVIKDAKMYDYSIRNGEIS